MNKLDKLTSDLSELDKIANDLGVLSYSDNLYLGEIPRIHLNQNIFLNIFDSFSLYSSSSLSLEISTHLNDCCVFALVEPETLGLKVKKVIYE